MCGCLFAIFAALSPRFALFLLWIFTDSVNRAFNGIIIPILGFIFLPFTTIIYVLVYSPTQGLSFWDWVLLGLALMLDLGSYAGSAYTNKDRIQNPTGSGSTQAIETEAKKVE